MLGACSTCHSPVTALSLPHNRALLLLPSMPVEYAALMVDLAHQPRGALVRLLAAVAQRGEPQRQVGGRLDPEIAANLGPHLAKIGHAAVDRLMLGQRVAG